LRQHHQQTRSDRCRRVHYLKDAGVSILEISRRLNMSRGTVYRTLRLDPNTAGERTRHVPSGLDPYLPYLTQRWAEGWHIGMQLYREIVGKGYKGSRKMVAIWTLQQRTQPAPTTPHRYRTTPDGPGSQETSAAGASIPARLPAPRSVAFLLMRRPSLLTTTEKQALQGILAASPEIRLAYPLIHQFAAMLRSHVVDKLAPWIQAAKDSLLPDLQNYAAGLEKDRGAVEAAVSQTWSNGQTEGQVNRLKMLKRQMYGRANFDLLRLRVLYI
jgi:transposase